MRNKRLIILLSVVVTVVLCIVVCGATFLVRHVEAYNYYVDSPDYDDKVIEASGIKTGSSIFFVDEAGITRKIESAFADVGVVNIERKFPDRVSINYVVYGNLFQFAGGDGYLQCYSSGRIFSSSATPQSGFFVVKPRDKVNTEVGAFFQERTGYDMSLIKSFTDYMHSAGLIDAQITERVAFMDLTRDGYCYIRMRSGCSIEIKGTGDEFSTLLDDGWSVYAEGKPDFPVNRETGLIRVWMNRSDPDNPTPRVTYSPTDNEEYYSEHYVRA